ncbi:hypothetical protein ACQHGV_06060 [Sphingomonas pseudosanguinis]|uniref:hypothetical protein n=1 Tax=Sphingomonas pseudosanguinis TaxID=413712 RepID=UPI003F85F8FB
MSGIDGGWDRARSGGAETHRLTAWLEVYLKAQDARRRMFPAGLMGDPAWDMMVDLFVTEAKGKRLSVSSASVATRTAQTTGLRWINRLVDEGLVIRLSDSTDRRRNFLVLSDGSWARVRDWARETSAALAAATQD